MDSPAQAYVDLDAISGNVAALREHVTPSAVMAVVKASGYGHGAVAAARAAIRGGARWLGVVHVAEALELRAAGIEDPVLCLMAIGSNAHAAAIEAGVDVSAGSIDMRQSRGPSMPAARSSSASATCTTPSHCAPPRTAALAAATAPCP